MSEIEVIDPVEPVLQDGGNKASTSGPDWKKIVRSEFMRLRTMKKQKHAEQVRVSYKNSKRYTM